MLKIVYGLKFTVHVSSGDGVDVFVPIASFLRCIELRWFADPVQRVGMQCGDSITRLFQSSIPL